jgi:hypothetical protein
MRVAAPVLFACAIAVLQPAVAEGQPRPAARSLEAAFGALWVGTMPLGDRSADLSRPDGGPQSLFRTDVSIGPGPGAEVHVSKAVSPGFAAELSGSWTRLEVRTEVTADTEGAALVTATTSLSRISIEGSGLWTLAGDGDATSFFVRAGGGWMRELAAGAVLGAAGAVGNAGAGVKYWWGTSIPGRGRRWGLRVDGRAVLRWRGVDLGTRAVRVAPAASANLMIRF